MGDHSLSSGPTITKLWPSPQDYNEAVQNIHVNLSDAELREGEIELDALGLSRPMTGAFASVYKVKCATRDLALRCFLRNVPDVQMRYEKISEFIMHDSLACTVGFDFQNESVIYEHCQWEIIL